MPGQIPTLEEALRRVELLLKYFFNRDDFVAVKMPWGNPHPVMGLDNLRGLLLAHVMGEASPHPAVARYTNRNGSIRARTGHFRAGTYAPDKDGNTRWLCVDFDGAGHSDPLADPQQAALLTVEAFAAQGIPAYMERSGGGKGWHVWVFFNQPTPAKLVRQLAHRLVPSNLPLAQGRGVAMPTRNRGVEIFPKQDKPNKASQLGNLVWLPHFHGAPDGANQFYRMEAGELVEYQPEAFETVSLEQLESTLARLSDPKSEASPASQSPRAIVDDAATEAFLKVAMKDDQARPPPSQDWLAWKQRALGLLDLERIYGRWLTGRDKGSGWLECQDPESASGADSRSGEVADGGGLAWPGTFHSFRTEETMSVFDFMVRHGLASSFIDAARQIADWTGVPLPARPNHSGPTPPGCPSYPVIVVGRRQLRDILWDAWEVLLAANRTAPFLFRRSGRLVALRFAGHAPQMEFVDEATLYGILAAHATWVKRSEEGDIDVMPPKEAARVMLTCADPRLHGLEAVVSAPTFDERARLSTAPGYQPDAEVWYHEQPGFNLPAVPSNPTEDDIARARHLILNELFVDFPFVSQADRAHAVAGLILPFVRRLIPGPTPVHLFEAQMPGAGKTLLAEVISIVATGESADPTTLGRDDEETRKKITSLLSLGRSVVLIDNVRGGIDSVNLAAALTAEIWQDRLLGQNTMIRLPNRTVWLVTANNPDLTLEIARRSIRIRIEPNTERPWQREGFKHSPLKSWVREHRSELVWAVLVLVQAWIAGGCPKGTRTLGSFEQWADVVGGILEEAGITGFLGNTEELYQAADVEGQEFREFVQVWFDAHSTTPVSAGELLRLAQGSDLLMTQLGSKSERSQAIRLGKVLKANRNRRYGDLLVETTWTARTKQNEWRLVKVTQEDSTPVRGQVLDLFAPRDVARDVEAQRGMLPDVENLTSRALPPASQQAQTDVRGMSRDVNPNLACVITHNAHVDARAGAGYYKGANPAQHPATSREPSQTSQPGGPAEPDVRSQHPAQHPASPTQHPAPAPSEVDLADFCDPDEEDS